MGHNLVRAFVIFCLSFLTSAALADRITLQDGRTFEGEVAVEDADTVSLIISQPGRTLTQQFKKSQIKTWDRPVHQRPAYIRIPILGESGRELTGKAVHAGLE